MVRSMIAGVAGLKTHQAKLDVIGNNIANVNTWGFKSYSFNFQDSMYSTSINGSKGDDMGGGAGGRNASQVGYGVTTSSISNEFGTGAPAPSSNPLDCMIDGTGFFLVGNMINGSFQSVVDSGLNLSRVGIFRVDGNGYLVDDQRSYVYGYALKPGTGVPETPATKAEYRVEQTDVLDEPSPDGGYDVTIGGVTVHSVKKTFKERIQDWVAKAPALEDSPLAGYGVMLSNYQDPILDDPNGPVNGTVNIKILKNQSGDDSQNVGNIKALFETGNFGITNLGNIRIAGIAAEYSDELSTIQIPIDPNTGAPYEIQSYKINEDGTIVGVDTQSRTITIGQLALVTVENPNGLEKASGYYYNIGANSGDVAAIKPNGGPAGKIMGNYLEMANVDLANEFSQMITTQRGYQANSKIITVTDQMLEELVNLKR